MNESPNAETRKMPSGGWDAYSLLLLIPEEFAPICKSGNDKIREEWEKMRIQTMYSVNVQIKPIDQVWNPKVFMPFVWEEQSELELKAIDWDSLDQKYARTSLN